MSSVQYFCQEGDASWRLVDVYGRPVAGSGVEDVTRRMCGGAYEWIYRERTIETAVDDAEVMKVFLEARQEIEGR